MSLSGSLAPSGAKLNESDLHYGDEPEGPGASVENPAGVFPQAGAVEAAKSQQNRTQTPMGSGGGQSGKTAQAVPQASGGIPGTGNPSDTADDPRLIFSNPQMFSEVMMKLSTSFTEAIQSIEEESGSGIGGVGRQVIDKLKGWRNEVDLLRAGKGISAAQGQGGVEKDGEGGLYAD